MTGPRPIEPLSQQRQTTVASASRTRISSALSTLAVDQDGKWLDSSNPYQHGVKSVVREDGNTIPIARQGEFLKYLAASTFVHCGDGWTYFGRALDALVHGDVETCVHLAYYAELRAAISILSGEGIYVGDKVNIVVTSNGDFDVETALPTHLAAWAYLAAWVETARPSALLGRMVRAENADLDEWIANMITGGSQPVVAELFEDLAIDLRTFAADRSRRNRASYDPTRLTVGALPTDFTFRVVANLWLSVEPDRRGGFPLIDQALLRTVVARTFQSIHAEPDISDIDEDSSGSAPVSWASWVKAAAPEGATGSPFLSSLLVEDAPRSPNSSLTSAFHEDADETGPSEFIESMLSRTLVLLRIATGSAIQLAEEGGIDDADLLPWVEILGISRGYWSPDSPPESMIDLWQDVAPSMEIAHNIGDLSRHAAFLTDGLQTLPLGQTERVVAWSFA